jgi:uncharacterized membrane protein
VCSVSTLIALIALMLAWELVLAPLRPGGSWLALKALPLIVPLRGIVAGKVYTHQWATLLVLAYFAEGCVRAYTDTAPASLLALAEIAIAAAFFAAAIAFVRAARRP